MADIADIHALGRADEASGDRISRPLVSVIIPVYNLEDYLKEAVDSVLGQTCRDFEVILIDDGSTDRSREVMEKYSREFPDRIICRFQKHLGAAAARNHGIEMARGAWIAFLDGDDIWKADKLEIQLRETAKDPGINFLSSAAGLLDRDGLFSEWIPSSPDIKLELMLKGCFIVLSSVMMRRDLLAATSFNEELPGAQDLDLYLRLAERIRFRYISKPLVLYRMRKNAISDPQTTRYLQLDRHCRIIRRETIKMAMTDPVQFNRYKRELDSVMARLAHEAAYFSLISRTASCSSRIAMSWGAIRENPARLKNYRFLMQALLPGQINRWLQRRNRE